MEYLKVRMRNDLTKSSTRYKYKLDGDGHMKRMGGKIFTLDMDRTTFDKRVDSIEIWCEEAERSYTFSKKDLTPIDDLILPPFPKPKLFNPKHLDL